MARAADPLAGAEEVAEDSQVHLLKSTAMPLEFVSYHGKCGWDVCCLRLVLLLGCQASLCGTVAWYGSGGGL